MIKLAKTFVLPLAFSLRSWCVDLQKMDLRLQEHSGPSNGGQTTNWPDLAATATKESRTVSQLFDTHWFCRYPRPRKVIHDNGTEFKGYKFQDMYSSYGVRLQPTTVKNPRSNLVAERIHLTMDDILHASFFEEEEWPQEFDVAL